MSAMTIFSGAFCGAASVVQELIQATGYNLVTDKEIVSAAGELSGISEKKISRILADKTSVFNPFTHEKERSLAYLRLAAARQFLENNFLIHGLTGMLIPSSIHHVLRVCIIADMNHRVAAASRRRGIDQEEAQLVVHQADTVQGAWVNSLFKINDPWDPSLYDIVVPMDKQSVPEVVSLVTENLKSEVIQPTRASVKATEDFLLAAQIEVELAREGHAVTVGVRDGLVTLTIRENVLMLKRLEEELKNIVNRVTGVKSIETRIGKGFYKTDIYRKYDFQVPSKVLLVDDEREFVQTLSERLLLRDVGSAVVFDGESALNLVEDDEPEVMILDLKMPGIDGIEVLKQVKAKRPDIEVIILTGHGSEADREVCMDLGAFAYLQKPVNIELLSKTLQQANDKIKQVKDR